MTQTELSPQGRDREPGAMDARGPKDVYKASRPGGVTVLAVFQVLSGVLVIGLALVGREALLGGANALGLFSEQEVAISVLVGLSRIAAGIGMWTGKRWGWWLAAFTYLYALLTNTATALLMPALVETYGEPTRGVWYTTAREVADVVWGVVILIYWFRASVLDYFDLLDMSKVKALAGLVAATLLAFGAVYLVAGATDRELDRIASVYESGDLASAAEELEQYLESNPDDDMAWTLLGYVRRDTYELEDAEAALNRALELNARSAEAWNGLGLVAEEMGDGERALVCYEKAVEVDPSYTAAHVNLSYEALQLYEDAKALEHAERAYELDKREPNVVINLAVVYHYHGMYEQRDEMMAEAERLGYEDMDIVQLLFDGVWSVRE